MLRVRAEHEHPSPPRARIGVAYRTATDRLDRGDRPRCRDPGSVLEGKPRRAVAKSRRLSNSPEADMIRKNAPTLAIAALSLALLDIPAAQAASQTLEKIKEVGKVT